ncbi:TIGR01777 family oxidoreductase [Desulforhabdus amnigena]|uniref:Epimerase n=1 Tax=Desulforhabdus amnigena TaxID=40218 RepID=A0A9W6FWT7_9BACT|nr:TIGR01777 family oxidoreductase [Desulforhabdus amnigena]NLJ29866.1 TIGR01777 family protein [Deltaproteobacteria bacterium]GLI36263.1 epimerase [Desulforhabdus amnigena]
MKIFMTGGTGFVGGYLTRKLAQEGHEITVLSRSRRKAHEGVSHISFTRGDPKVPGPWQEILAAHDVVINLAGTSIFSPWTKKTRQSILESRVLSTRNVVDALSGNGKDKVLLSGSAVGYYGGRLDDEVLIESSPPGRDFLSEVAIQWEREAQRAESFGVRVVICRFGIVLGKKGGALSKMIPPFNLYFGSPLGSGKQWFPWIHEEDLSRIMEFLIENKNIYGVVNCMSPHPVRNRELVKALADALGKPAFLPSIPGFMLKMIMGDFANVILKGQRAIPQKLMDAGFEFKYPLLKDTLKDLLGR